MIETIVPHYKNIKDTIKRMAEVYRMVRYGRGPTHEQAYLQGCKDTLDLIKSGKYSLDQI